MAAIRAELEQERRLDLSSSALLVTAGSNMAFNAVAQALCDPGDEVILPAPAYFNHVMAVQLAGAVPVLVEGGAIPDPERLAAAITPRTRAIVTVSPNNPSGVVIPAPVLAAINRLCALHGLFHICDEAYELFVHGREPHWSAGSLPGSAAHTVSLHSLSKAYGMAGWRLGYMAVPAALLPALHKLQDTVLICPPRLTQHAARAALVAGPAEAEIRGVLDQPERAGQGGQGLGGAVRGGVVHHGDLHGRGVPRGREAREAGAQQRAAVPVDDHHVEGRAVGHGRSRGGPRRPRAPSRAAARSLSSTAGRQPESAQYSPAWSGR